MHKAHKATRPVAAVLDLTTVGVVDDVFKVHVGRGCGSHAQNLVGAHTKMAIGQAPVMRRAQGLAFLGFIEHNKVVARTLHFGESDAHARIIVLAPRPRWAARNPPWCS